MKNLSVVNIDSSSDAKSHYNNSLSWKNYAHRMARQPFMKNYIYTKNHGICQFCGKHVGYENSVIHHITYMHECRYKTKKIDCEKCQCTHPECFDECTKNITVVCLSCNWIIEKIYCKQHPEHTSSAIKSWHGKRNKYDFGKDLKNIIDEIISHASSYADFKIMLSQHNILYKDSGKYNVFSLSAEEYEKRSGNPVNVSKMSKRGRSLGEKYTTENLKSYFNNLSVVT